VLYQVVTVALFGALVAVALRDDALVVVLAVYLPLLFGAVFCWLYCQIVDPAKEGGFGLPCIKESQKVPRYCSACKKMVPGLDHHCKWLNTCIGKRNYLQFFLLTCFGWMFPLVQFAVCLFVSVDEETRNEMVARSGVGIYFLVALSGVLSLGLVQHYGNLFQFHVQLLSKGQGTYLYMLEERKRTLEKRRLEREADAAAQGHGSQEAEDASTPSAAKSSPTSADPDLELAKGSAEAPSSSPDSRLSET